LADALGAAWMEHVLCSESSCADSYRNLLDSQRALADLFTAHNRTDEAAFLYEQTVAEAAKFQRSHPDSPEALALLADAQDSLARWRTRAGASQPQELNLAKAYRKKAEYLRVSQRVP
jgi:hypothetical protein